MMRAIHYLDRNAFLVDNVAGSFWVSDPDEAGVQLFWFVCPCGCGRRTFVRVGNGFKPRIEKPSWSWNGSTSSPELNPSVNWVDHWHGWLRAGVWRPC